MKKTLLGAAMLCLAVVGCSSAPAETSAPVTTYTVDQNTFSLPASDVEAMLTAAAPEFMENAVLSPNDETKYYWISEGQDDTSLELGAFADSGKIQYFFVKGNEYYVSQNQIETPIGFVDQNAYDLMSSIVGRCSNLSDPEGFMSDLVENGTAAADDCAGMFTDIYGTMLFFGPESYMNSVQ